LGQRWTQGLFRSSDLWERHISLDTCLIGKIKVSTQRVDEDSLVARTRDYQAAKACDRDVGGLSNQRYVLEVP
jgi:hypothetical protein